MSSFKKALDLPKADSTTTIEGLTKSNNTRNNNKTNNRKINNKRNNDKRNAKQND